MADERPKAEDPFASLNIAEDAEANWGEDWESAFQSEENTFISEEAPPEPAKPAAGKAAQPDPLSAPLARQSPDPKRTATAPGSGVTFATIAGHLVSGVLTTGRQLFQRLQALPLFLRVPLYLLPAALVLLVLVTGNGSDSPLPPQSPAQGTEGRSLFPASGGDNRQAPAEKIRKKWEFPSFLIPVETPGSDEPVTFIHIDITLIAVLDPKEEPPTEKEIPVREMIYQFYRSLPLGELRRFSLARGEMNRKLRDWLRKEWPEAPIESIIFDRYTLS